MLSLVLIKTRNAPIPTMKIRQILGVFRNLSRGGLKFISLSRGAQHLLGPENPLKSIDFTGPGGELSPPPLNTPLRQIQH